MKRFAKKVDGWNLIATPYYRWKMKNKRFLKCRNQAILSSSLDLNNVNTKPLRLQRCIHSSKRKQNKIRGQWADANLRSQEGQITVFIFQNYALFLDFLAETNKTELDNKNELDFGMVMHGLLEYGENYSKTSRSLYQYGRDERNANITNSRSIQSEIMYQL